MSAPASAANSIETAAALLESELTQLEKQQEALQEQLQSVQAELAATSGSIESIRGALAALRSVATAAVPRLPTAQAMIQPSDASEEHDSSAPADSEAASTAVSQDPPTAQLAPMTTRSETNRFDDESDAASSAHLATPGSRFTEQVIAVLMHRPHAALRARDVAEALGRDENAGSINAVRSTLDRLVATSRARRVGKGLYQAPTPT